MVDLLVGTAPQTNLFALDEQDMTAFVARLGWPRYRAVQILRWLHQRRIPDSAGMTDLSQSHRRTLAEVATIRRAERCEVRRSEDGTRKLLVTLEDGLTVETVLIPDNGRLTLCVSTQVGCTLDCAFCLTGTMGLMRNLRAHEIVDQVLTAQDNLNIGERLTNMVFMGMGEPLANFHELAGALTRITNVSWGLGFSPRRITVSTAGLSSRFKDVAALGVNLAVSLNATTEAQRAQLMPAAERIATLKRLLAACRRYPLAPQRRLTFEYVLLAGVNDRCDDARRFAALLRGLCCKVNLIPFNEFPGSVFRRPADLDVTAFQSVLRRHGIDTFIRKSRGRDVLGACGQLGTLGAGSRPLSLTQIESRC